MLAQMFHFALQTTQQQARRNAADKERERANQAFMLKLLHIAMGKTNDS
jgi:hypothetical protein